MFFYQSDYLFLILVLLFLGLIYIIQSHLRIKKLKYYLGKQEKFLTEFISEPKRRLKTLFQILSLLFCILALARPQVIGGKEDVESAGVYVLLAVDISRSMLAEDVKPNRLSFMKRELGRFLDISSGDQAALITFARSSILVSPFTKDLSAVKIYLNDLTPDYFSHQGTDFGRAFDSISRVFETISSKKNKATVKVAIIASDGEDHSKTAKNKIKELLAKDIRIFTLSFGTKDGGVIPVKDNKEKLLEYKKNASGKLIVTKLNAKDLKEFARLGKGAYYHVTYGSQSIKKLRDNIDTLEKTTFETSSVVKKREVYYIFLVLALIFALLDLVIHERKKTGRI